MLAKIPSYILELYRPVSLWESFYLRTRWRLCPYELVESLLPEKGRILDFGCGYGMLTNLLASRSPLRSAFGIDLNKKRIHVAERSVRNRNNITFRCGDIKGLDVAQFDAVVMTDVLHHIDETNIKILLEKISSCLRSEGILAILDVDKTPFWKFCITYVIDKLLNLKTPLHYSGVRRIERLLEKFPLSIEKIIPADQGLPLSDIIYLCRKKPL